MRGVILIVVVLLAAGPAAANWLSTLGEIAATSGKAGRVVSEMSAGLEGAARIIDKLPALAKKTAVAAEALPDGAWRFRNSAGDVITATGTDGVKGALKGLAVDGDNLALYLNEEAAFTGAGALDGLPETAKLHVVVDDTPFPLLRQGKGEAARLYAVLDSNVIVALTDQKLFGEAVWQLKRPLGKSGIRVASLDTTGPAFLPAAGARTAEGLPQAEVLNAANIATGLASMRGQTLIVTGSAEGDVLKFTGITGESGSVAIPDLMHAAEQQDVNLLLLDGGTPKQPGGTTWLLQTRGIAHIDKAMAEASLGDFIAALGKGQGRMEIETDWGQSGHLRLSAAPARAQAPVASGEIKAAGVGERVTDFAAELARQLAGQVVPGSATASLNSRDTQWDLDSRLIPGIPAGLQIWYAVSWIFGLLGFSQARWWWRLITRTRANALSWPWRGLYEAGYWLIFAPLVGTFAFAAVVLKSVFDQLYGFWLILTWPFRSKGVRPL